MKKVKLQSDANGQAVQGALCPYSTVVVAFNASARSAALTGEIVRLIADQDCHVVFGDSGCVATTSNMFLKANQVEYFALRGNQYIAAIKNASAGNLYITLMI